MGGYCADRRADPTVAGPGGQDFDSTRSSGHHARPAARRAADITRRSATAEEAQQQEESLTEKQQPQPSWIQQVHAESESKIDTSTTRSSQKKTKAS